MAEDDAGQEQNPLQKLIAWRVGAAMEPQAPNETLLRLQQPPMDLLDKYWFRLEVEGWDRVPDETCLVIGVHSGGALTMDAWTLVNAWHEHFEGRRPLHGTAHDVLLAAPGLGDYFRAVGVIAADRKSVTAALAQGEDVVVWPGGEVDAMRSLVQATTIPTAPTTRPTCRSSTTRSRRRSRPGWTGSPPSGPCRSSADQSAFLDGGAAGGQAGSPMTARRSEHLVAGRYEYKVEEIREGLIGGKMSGGKLEKVLNEHARAGWQLKAITSVEVKGRIGPGGVEGVLVTFERPVS